MADGVGQDTCPCCGQPLPGARQSGGAPIGSFEAMVLACIDPRMQAPVTAYLAGRGLIGRYSQLTLSGAAIGVVAPAFADWQKSFWDNLAISRQLHGINRLITIDHRDCGASRIAFGAEVIADPLREAEAHRSTLAELRRQAAERHPDLTVETALMALDGSLTVFDHN